MLIVNRETVGQTTTVGVACDVCGLRVEDPGRDATSAGYGTLAAAWGCGSPHFGLKHEAHLCEECFGEVAEFVRGLGGRVREQDLFDPAAGQVIEEPADEYEWSDGVAVIPFPHPVG